MGSMLPPRAMVNTPGWEWSRWGASDIDGQTRKG